jgi:hypothetical protein
MQPYNVEIFSQNMELIQHYNAGDIAYKFDYLSTDENTISIAYNPVVKQGDYIRITDNTSEYFGVINGITVGEETNTTSNIRYVPFISLFNTEILFDTTLQGSNTSLEDMLAKYIRDYFIDNADALQNIPGLRVETISRTADWGFHLTSDIAGLNKTIINFMTVLIQRAMTKYQVGLYVEPDFVKKQIVLKIGRKTSNVFHIESDLPNIVKRSIVLNETTQDLNKLIVYNNENLSDLIVYYKHPDKTYDTNDANRISPVIYDIQTVTPTEEQPFKQAADALAARTFDTESYNNLIELTVLNDDELVNPRNIFIGQEVAVVSGGTAYSSILTGYEISTKTKLIFGTIRLDLTKILKGERNGR